MISLYNPFESDRFRSLPLVVGGCPNSPRLGLTLVNGNRTVSDIIFRWQSLSIRESLVCQELSEDGSSPISAVNSVVTKFNSYPVGWVDGGNPTSQGLEDKKHN